MKNFKLVGAGVVVAVVVVALPFAIAQRTNSRFLRNRR